MNISIDPKKTHKKESKETRDRRPCSNIQSPLSNKLTEKWFSSYKVKEKIDPDAFIVIRNGKEYMVNKAYIKKDFSIEDSKEVKEEVSYK